MRPNVVSAGIFLGLALFAISVLSALYASPWQAATILATLVGIFSSISLYFGGRDESHLLAQQLAQAQERARLLARDLATAQTRARSLGQALARAQLNLPENAFNLHENEHNLLRDAVFVVHLHLLIAEETEEEPPLFV